MKLVGRPHVPCVLNLGVIAKVCLIYANIFAIYVIICLW